MRQLVRRDLKAGHSSAPAGALRPPSDAKMEHIVDSLPLAGGMECGSEPEMMGEAFRRIPAGFTFAARIAQVARTWRSPGFWGLRKCVA